MLQLKLNYYSLFQHSVLIFANYRQCKLTKKNLVNNTNIKPLQSLMKILSIQY